MANRSMLRLVPVLAAAALLAAACQPQDETALSALPTLAELPSLTPSDTPSPTPTPTPTASPTDTLTPTATNTSTPTLTFTPSITATPSVTPTFTLTPTPTASSTPTPTDTPTASPTPITPEILSFTASATTVAANTPITLAWTANADSARIEQLNQQGAVTQAFPVVPSGQLVVTVPANQGRVIVYRLVAIRSGQEISRSIPITLTCSIDWFFGNEFAPPGSGCPTAVGAIGPGAFQQFERGLMIYVNANALNRIYGLQNAGNRYASFVNGWNNTSLAYDPAPSGFFQPELMFRWAFLNTLAPVSTWQAQIGWGTSAADQGQRTIQFEEGGPFYIDPFYIDSPIGVFRFSGGDQGTWTRIR
ncbi:MAG: hypothetical protein ACUVSX_09275 [Aggregatilineales bacterium]